MKVFLKIIGIINLLIACFLFSGIAYLYSFIDGTIVLKPTLRIIFFAIVMLVSGIGILFRKKSFFIITFYSYIFLILDRLSRIYQILSTTTIDSNHPVLQNIILLSVFNSSIVILLSITVIGLFLNKQILKIFNILNKKEIYQHMSIAFVLFFMFLFFIY